MNNPNLFAPCGTYCGICVWRVAYITKDEKLKAKLCKMIPGMKPEQIVCDGCRSDTPLYLCEMCKMKKCESKKEDVESCAECDEFPCKIITTWSDPLDKKVMLSAIPAWRDLGTEKWVEAEEKRYKCPKCGNLLYHGAKKCKKCNFSVDLD